MFVSEWGYYPMNRRGVTNDRNVQPSHTRRPLWACVIVNFAVVVIVASYSACSIQAKLETTPQGATVLVNEEVRGQTPLELRVPRSAEPAQIELRLDGYESARETIRTDMNGRYRVALTPRRRKATRPRVGPAKTPRATPPPEKVKAPAFRAFD